MWGIENDDDLSKGGGPKKFYDNPPELENLLLDGYFQNAIVKTQAGWRKVLVTAVQAGVPVPAMSSALSFYDGFRTEKLRLTYYRYSGIILMRIPMSEPTSRVVSFFIQIGKIWRSTKMI